MLYSNEKQGTTSFRGKVWKLPSGLWRACNYSGQQCSYKLYNEAHTFSQKGKDLNEAFSPNELKPLSVPGLRGLLASWQKRLKLSPHSQPIISNIEAIENALELKTEGLKRQQTRYRPELSRSEMEKLVKNLKDQGYKATASGPNLKTDATDKAIEMAEGVVYIMCEDG